MASSDKVKGPASYFPSIEARYGQPVSHWLGILQAAGDRKHMELVSLLKSDHGLGHGHANALVAAWAAPAVRRTSHPRTRLRCERQPGWRCAACRLDVDGPRVNPDIEAERGPGKTSGACRIGQRQQPWRQFRQFRQFQTIFKPSGPALARRRLARPRGRGRLKIPCAMAALCPNTQQQAQGDGQWLLIGGDARRLWLALKHPASPA
jgi:hypothetical protein